MNQRLVQAYQQAPWRMQVQRIAYFMLGLIVVALIAGVYLNVTAQSAAAGVAVQELETERETILRNNADLKFRLARLTTINEMKKRAQDLGFEPINTDEVIYMVIPEYLGRQVPLMTNAPSARALPRPVIKPSYTQSLWEWILTEMTDLNRKKSGGQP